MKKYLTAFIAAIAAISLSAFTFPKKNSSDNLTTYYWYELNQQKTHTEGEALNEEKLSEAEMIDVYIVCEDDGTPACLAGFENEVISPQAISGLTEGEIIRETN